MVTLDAAGVILQSNRAFAVLMGLREDAGFAGESIEALLPAECADDLAGVIRRGYRMGAASTEVEFHARGRTIHLAMTSARLDLGAGQAGTVLVVEDTTELLRAQRQLAWKEVAQQVAHEIKNPLTPIALSAERIGRHLDRGQPDSPNIIRKCSEVILGCVGTLRTLVDQFSALAHFPAPQPRPCGMNQIVEEALALFGGRLEGITVQRDLEPGLPTVMADPEAIRRALANLIDNAAEAMQGSLLRVLGVYTALSEDGAAVEVTVSDTGHGLTDEIRERLFLPFYSTKHRGTGLGLSIAAKIVQEHGGSISAESNTPKGARFLLRLPLMDPAAQFSPAAPHAPIPATVDEEARLMNHILVVDDEAEIRTSLEEILREEGYGVAGAAMRGEAMSASRRALRRRSARHLAARPRRPRLLADMRELPPETRPEVVMISGHGTIETAVKATKLGAYDFLEKPLSLDRTLIVVKNAVEARRMRTENRGVQAPVQRRLGPHRRKRSRQGAAPANPPHGAHQRPRSHLRRVGHRQRTHRALHSRREPAPRPSLCRAQLRRHP